MNENFEIKINDAFEQLCVYNMIFLDDISQQVENDEFLQHQTNMRCRICLCSKIERDNLEYDIVMNDKYHWETITQRQYVLN